jgi:superfamily II DNA/RNA helicase
MLFRVGRTARAGRAGRAVTFVSQYDVELYQRIEHLLGKRLPFGNWDCIDKQFKASSVMGIDI